MLVPLGAALTQATTLIADKELLSKERISRRDFVPLTFLLLCAYAGVFSFFVGWVDPWAYFTLYGLGLTGAVIVLGIAWNWVYFRAIQSERVSAVENIMILSPLATILLSGFFSPGTLALSTVVAALAATGLLFWGFRSHRGLRLDHNLLLLLASVAAMALENIAVAKLLQADIISPVTFFAIRTGVIGLFFYAWYRPKFERMKHSHLERVAILSALGAVMMLMRFYGLRDAGVVTTSLALILVPVMVYAGAGFFLKERLKKRQVVAGVGMALIVAAATVWP
jgi:drug/metabolite transporter (DMT)-like permease